ncbi:zinc-ribbon domain-containing protein [Lactobacillus sp. Marseille-P7033]|nr:zinc-ribbon domain-containing protein [Lactobacillus sp. Marseille-P7033]NGC77635.1 zinc-ribbon domain-containing protein [Limosilactobacillus reuteri]
MKRCPRCNTVNEDTATTCVNCGTVLTPQILALVCPKCGKVSPLGTKTCPVCHEKLTDRHQEIVNHAVTVQKTNKVEKLYAWLLIVVFCVLLLIIGTRYSQIKKTVDIYPEYVGGRSNLPR